MKEVGLIIVGFVLGIVGTLITQNPRITNRFLRLAKIIVRNREHKISGKKLIVILGEYEIINGYPEPLMFHEVFIEFKDKNIMGLSLAPSSTAEVMNPPKGKFILYKSEFSVPHFHKQDFALDNRTLLAQIEKKKKVKYRVCIFTSRYGTLCSNWNTVEFNFPK